MRGSTSRTRPAPADAHRAVAGRGQHHLGAAAPPRVRRTRPARRRSASAVCANTTSSGPTQLGTASRQHDRDRAAGPSRAASRPTRARPRPAGAAARARGGGARAAPATPASCAACAAERTWAPAVAAERSTPPVSSAARARASARRVSSSTGHPCADRRAASSSSSTGMPSTTGKLRPHDGAGQHVGVRVGRSRRAAGRGRPRGRPGSPSAAGRATRPRGLLRRGLPRDSASSRTSARRSRADDREHLVAQRGHRGLRRRPRR